MKLPYSRPHTLYSSDSAAVVDIQIKGVSSFLIPARGIIAGQGGSMSQSKAVIFPPNKVRQPLLPWPNSLA